MSADEALRRAAAQSDRATAVAALDRVFAMWRAPGSLWRERLMREHPLFSPQVIERGIEAGLRGWTGEVLEKLLERELSEGARVPGVTAVWLAGSIPTASFAAIALPLAAGSAVYAHPATADPVSGRLFAESLVAVDPDVARAVEVGDDPSLLELADAVVVHGSDETVRELRSRVSPHTPFVGYAHKLSAAAVGSDADLSQAADALAFDACLYDGRGCLSPAFSFVEDPDGTRAEPFAEALAGALTRLAAELPRGTLAPEEQARLHEVRSALQLREETRVWCSPGDLAWTVVLSRFEGHAPVAGTLRLVPVIPFREPAELESWLASLRPHLSCLGRIGFEGRTDALAKATLAAGGSRLCPLGEMQLPPLDWRHDGVGPILPLVRALDIEGSGSS